MNHSHVIYDADPHFKIDPITRNITNESSKKIKLIQHDHNSERFTFECPRYVEGHDLSKSDKVEVHYQNIEGNVTKTIRAGVYTVDDLQVHPDDENMVVCSWVIGNNATQLVGQLKFLLRFSCSNAETGTLEYAWHTEPYSNVTVSSGIYNADSASDTVIPPYNVITTINGRTVRVFIGTQAEYNLIDGNDPNTIYYITDDNTLGEIDADIDNSIATAINEITRKLQSGEIVVAKATHAATSDAAQTPTKVQNAVWADNAFQAHILSFTGEPITCRLSETGENNLNRDLLGLYAVMIVTDEGVRTGGMLFVSDTMGDDIVFTSKISNFNIQYTRVEYAVRGHIKVSFGEFLTQPATVYLYPVMTMPWN